LRQTLLLTCFIEAGFRTDHRRCSGTVLASRHTAPAATGDATLVPARGAGAATASECNHCHSRVPHSWCPQGASVRPQPVSAATAKAGCRIAGACRGCRCSAPVNEIQSSLGSCLQCSHGQRGTLPCCCLQGVCARGSQQGKRSGEAAFVPVRERSSSVCLHGASERGGKQESKPSPEPAKGQRDTVSATKGRRERASRLAWEPTRDQHQGIETGIKV